MASTVKRSPGPRSIRPSIPKAMASIRKSSADAAKRIQNPARGSKAGASGGGKGSDGGGAGGVEGDDARVEGDEEPGASGDAADDDSTQVAFQSLPESPKHHSSMAGGGETLPQPEPIAAA